MDADAWPRFADPFLEAIKDILRIRDGALRYRGRYFVDGDSGDGATEELTATVNTHVRRCVTMTCRAGGRVSLEIRSTRRSEHLAALLRLTKTLVPRQAALVVAAFEQTLSIVMRSPRGFDGPVVALWAGLG